MIQSINSSKDAFVSQYDPYTNYEGAQYLYVGNNGVTGTTFKSFIYFDLSQIPTTVSIESAQLKLYVLNKTIAGPVTANMYKLNESFDPSFITWNTASIMPMTPITEIISISTADEYYTTDISDVVQNWINGTTVNNGLAISINSNVQGYVSFASGNNATTLFQPVLIIEYGNSQLEQTNITSGNFNIITSTSNIENNDVATTHAITNTGTQAYNQGLGVIQLNYNNQWYDEKSTTIYPGSTNVISTWAAMNKERLTILSSKASKIYAFVTAGGNYDLKQALQVNNNIDTLTNQYTNQTQLLCADTDTGATPLTINSSGIVTVPSGLSLTSNVDRTINVMLKNINSTIPDKLSLSNTLVSSATIANVSNALLASGVAVAINITPSNSVTLGTNTITVMTQYASFLTGLDSSIMKDLLIISNKSLAGLNVDISYHDKSNQTFTPIVTNKPLSGTSMNLSQITGVTPATLVSKNGNTDYYQITINPSSTATGTFELSFIDIAGAMSGTTINPANMKYLHESPSVTITI